MKAHLVAGYAKIFSSVSNIFSETAFALKQGRRKQNPAGTVQAEVSALMYSTVVHAYIEECIKAVLLASGLLDKAPWLCSSTLGPVCSTRASTVNFELLLPLKRYAANNAVPPHSNCHSALRLCQLL